MRPSTPAPAQAVFQAFAKLLIRRPPVFFPVRWNTHGERMPCFFIGRHAPRVLALWTWSDKST